ncbi:MAG: TonB-dependent receptor [Candidatus Saccharicenans sp.]|nr:TonB-dependent receptor [Candidatus Saccharicenans sp.]
MSKKIFILLTILLVMAPLAFSQSRETGAIIGTVTDESGLPLPGVTVTISGPAIMGTRSTMTDARGTYRFPALPPGTYTIKAELQGFGDVVNRDIRLSTTSTLTIDLTMKQSTLEEEVTVVAKSPTVDVKSTETASVSLSNEILRNIPYSQFTADIVNMAPGVTNNVAFGASQNTGIAYTMDGVNVADPEAGSAWVFSDHNIVEEAKIMGVGLPAEYGNFTGVIFNLVTKSGGNNFSGHMEFDFQGKRTDKPKGLWGTENNAAYIDDFPLLTTPLLKLMDVNAHLGGPIIRDKLWFYVGLQYYRTWRYPTGFPEAVDYKQPRSFLKLTSQLTPSLSLTGSVQIDTYNGINRGAGATVSPEATVTQKSPEVVGNFSLTKIFSSKTFLDVKAAYFWGYYYLDPEVGMAPYMHFDFADNFQRFSSGYFYYADRQRFQANANLSHYVDDFYGSHDFKFGAEFERSMARSRYGFTGEGGELGDHVQYYDYYGYPYLAYQYDGYDINTRYTRLEAFAQDSWQVTKRLNINAGVRFSLYWGQVKGISGNVYTNSRISPRLGFTYDLFGDKTTVLKAHYGHFSEAMLTAYHDRMNPPSAYSSYNGYYYDWYDDDGDGIYDEWLLWFSIPHDQYLMDQDIKHPYMIQWTVSLERELFKDSSFSISYINRQWKNLIGPIDLNADYIERTVTVPNFGDYTVYERTLETLETPQYYITNLDRVYGDYPWIMQKPYRRYHGIQFQFNKRFSNRWQLLASYTLSKAWGTTDNGFADDIGYGGSVYDPNFWINSDGNSTYDPTHMIKIQGTYVIPTIELSVNVYYHGVTGNAWTTRYRTARFNQGRITFFIEPRGSNHYPMDHQIDIRLEKIFTFASKYRLGLMVDVFNLLNSDTITSWGTRWMYDWNPTIYPSTQGHALYGIVNARQARVGIRLIF